VAKGVARSRNETTVVCQDNDREEEEDRCEERGARARSENNRSENTAAPQGNATTTRLAFSDDDSKDWRTTDMCVLNDMPPGSRPHRDAPKTRSAGSSADIKRLSTQPVGTLQRRLAAASRESSNFARRDDEKKNR
jgi:hypothetical protein